jgi:hypothetical protein
VVWVRAGTSGELASLMRAADARLPNGEVSRDGGPVVGAGAPVTASGAGNGVWTAERPMLTTLRA